MKLQYFLQCVFDKILGVKIFSKFGIFENDFYLTRIIAAWTSEKIKFLSK